MTSDYSQIVSELNAGHVTLEMLDQLLVDYRATEYGSLKGEVLPLLLVVMTRLERSGCRQFPFAWVREHIEQPTHFYRKNDNSWELVYRFSDDHIGMIDIRDGIFSGYSRICCSEIPKDLLSLFDKWDNKMNWGRASVSPEESR